jgi:MraZ protein
MARFIGSELCMLDAKGRITVPARMRRNLTAEANNTFVILRSFDPCVNLYPADEFAQFDAKLSAALSEGDEDAREFARGIYATADEATLDSQGRLNIPDHLLEWAGVKKESMLIGNRSHLELWNPKTYEQRASSLDQDRLKNYAKRFLP